MRRSAQILGSVFTLLGVLLPACGRVDYAPIDIDDELDADSGLTTDELDGGHQANDDGGSFDAGRIEDSGEITTDAHLDDTHTGLDTLELLSPGRVVNRLDEARFSGRCSEDVALTGADARTFPCISGMFDVVVNETTDGARDYLLSLVSGRATPIPVTWIRDHSLPQVLSLTLDGGATISRDPTLAVALSGQDDLSNIVAFCLDWRPRAMPPVATDECFVPVAAPSPGLTPAQALRIDHYDYLVGFGPATYIVRTWLLDEAGNVSTLGAGGAGIDGVDRAAIEYRPGLAPILTDVWAANTRTPQLPMPASVLVVGTGTSVYISWAAQDDEALPAAPISIYYTTDERTYVPIATGLTNGTNGGCTIDSAGTTIDDRATGCFVWISTIATGEYARIRVIAEDSIGQRTAASASPFNLQDLRLLAGNFDPGTDASGRAAVFTGAIPAGNAHSGGISGLAVTRDGTIYFRDIFRGILVVTPEDGVQRVLVPLGPTSSGDGGPASTATVRMPLRLTLDHRDRLLIFDYDRIRRIDLNDSNHPIETLIGGGAETGDTAIARDVQITPPASSYGSPEAAEMPFFALPNGDIVFASDAFGEAPANGGRIRRYRAATGMVESLRVNGVVSELNPGQDVQFCAVSSLGVDYDLVTSEVTNAYVAAWADASSPSCPSPTQASSFVSFDFATGSIVGPGPTPYSATAYWKVTTFPVQGMNGRVYLMSRSPARIFTVDRASNAMVPIVGTGVTGRCPDGTPALDCNITPVEVFVDARGQLYFLDADVIRVIDETGAVRTVLGQRLDFGDGESPGSARFSTIPQLETWTDGSGRTRVVVMDPNAFRLREIQIGVDVQTIAGNGRNGTAGSGILAPNGPLLVLNGGGVFHGFALETNGTVWMPRGTDAIASFDRVSGRWVDRMGGGTRSFLQTATDGVIGSEVDLAPPGFQTYPAMMLGIRPGAVLAHKHTADATSLSYNESLIFEADLSDGRLNRVLGREGAFSQTRCADGTAIGNCAIWRSSFSLPAQWDATNTRWLWARRSDTVIRTISTTTIGTLTSATSELAGFVFQADVVYTCGTDGVLRRRPLDMSDTSIPLPPGMRCAGGMRHVSARASIVFSFEWNGLGGVAELTRL